MVADAIAPLLGDQSPESRVDPDDPAVTDGTTLATIEVTIPFSDPAVVVRVPNITSFSYSNDVLQVGNPFSVAVPDPRGIYLDKLVRGAKIVLSLSSPFVAGGAKIQKVTGRIIRRRLSCNAQGTVITLVCADIGWHLAHDDGELWFNLQSCTWETLILACIHPDQVFPGSVDPGWGFADSVNFEGNLNARLNQGRQGVILENQASDTVPLSRIQMEPGDKLFDVLSLYAKRLHLLVNVSRVGELQVYAPDYERDISYNFYCYPTTDPRRARNNVHEEGISLEESIEEVWSELICVGEVPLPDLNDEALKQDNVNASKFRGLYTAPDGLIDFTHRGVFTDGEALYRGYATERARWKAHMGLFNGHVLTFTVRDHHQNGLFYDAESLCHIEFPVIGIGPATYYISQVRCDRTDAGDTTTITAHLPGLLGA